ncbi:MAG TPA: DUF2460 domain-containing protein [Pyrinomonadaceae bacterium]|jgi:hypothetical protein
MAGAEFHEVLLDIEYAPGASGGASFSNSLLDAPSGIEQLASNSLKDRWRGAIDFNLLSPFGIEQLYSFFLCRGGNRCCFRFLPPRFNTFDNDLIAVADGTEESLSIYREFTDGLYTYRKRIVKPAWGTISLTLDGALVGCINENGVLEQPTFGGPVFGEWPPAVVVNLDYTTGIITPTSGNITAGEWRVFAGQFHLPVRFGSGSFNGRYDKVANQWGGITVEEVLPKTIGLS